MWGVLGSWDVVLVPMLPGLEVSGPNQLHPPCQVCRRDASIASPSRGCFKCQVLIYLSWQQVTIGNYVKEVLPLPVHIKHHEINMMTNFWMFSSRKVVNEQYYQTRAIAYPSRFLRVAVELRVQPINISNYSDIKHFMKVILKLCVCRSGFCSAGETAVCTVRDIETWLSDVGWVSLCLASCSRRRRGDRIISTQYEYITTCTSLQTRLHAAVSAPVPRTLSRAHTLRPWLFVRYCFLRLSWNGRYGMYYKYIWIQDKLTVTWLWSGVWYLVWLPNNWGCNWHHKGELSTLLYRQGIPKKKQI